MKESDIRDREILNYYLELVKEDCKKLFESDNLLVNVACPACESDLYKNEFTKNSFEYVTCTQCNTLFVRNRPRFDILMSFYSCSTSTDYWVNNFFKPKSEKRRELIFRPRAHDVKNRFGEDPKWIVGDIGAGFGIFLEELRRLWPKSKYVAVEPSINQAVICKEAHIKVECCPLEKLEGYQNHFDLLTAFELMEHLHHPVTFLRSIYNLLKPGGFFLAAMLNGEGFDIQILWEKSKSVTPPHHLNFFNPASLSQLLIHSGFKIMELDTPGVLDWDIVEGMIKNEGIDAGRFWSLLSEKGTPKAKSRFQEWIQTSMLSSHMRILACK